VRLPQVFLIDRCFLQRTTSGVMPKQKIWYNKHINKQMTPSALTDGVTQVETKKEEFPS
jgi:hypothetical protein